MSVETAKEIEVGTHVRFVQWVRKIGLRDEVKALFVPDETIGWVTSDRFKDHAGRTVIGVIWQMKHREVRMFMLPEEVGPVTVVDPPAPLEGRAQEAKGKKGQEAADRSSGRSDGAQKGPREVLVEPERIKGEIARSYSGDFIADHKGNSRVRIPFTHDGALYVAVGGSSTGWDAYRLVPREEFDGQTRTYADSVKGGRMSGYHGIEVKHRGKPCVLVGPKVTFRPAKEE